jgi:hypothetical protein
MSARRVSIGLRCAGLLLALSGAVALGSGAITACKGADDGASSQDSAETVMDKADWLDKTARLLRNGDGLGPRDDVDALLAMDPGAVVDQFMQDPRFGDMVLAFNQFYLSRSGAQLKTPLPGGGFSYSFSVFELPQALASAQAVVRGGNYFDLYSATPTAFRTSASRPLPVVTGGGGGDGGLGDGGSPPLTRRQRIEKNFADATAKLATDPKGACSDFQEAVFTAGSELSIEGFSHANDLSERWFGVPTPSSPNTLNCRIGGAPLTADELRGPFSVIQAGIEALFAAMDAAPAAAAINSIADLTPVPFQFDGLPPLVKPFGEEFWAVLPATSTNFQRKRAAYILRTYFCDDLTPNSIPSTVDAGGQDEKHASNPNCQACHYRLDPMGALFRNLGAGGIDQSAQNKISFSDGVTFADDQFQQYLSQWRNSDGSFRAGKYVIGPDGQPMRDPAWLETDGDTLDGLWSYLPRADAPRACLTRRLAEYVLGGKQVYDRDWLSQVARQAKFKPGPQSGAAFKAMVKALVLSKTFSTQDPKAGVCYDQPANAPANRPPCAVANIVANQCADCHSSVLARGHLDLTQWTLQADGAFSWPHNDDAGNPLSRTDSLQRILDRITSPDPDKRMPFQRSLESADLETFKTWLTFNLSPSPPGSPASP